MPELLLALAGPEPRNSWAPVVLLIVIGVLFSVGTLITSAVIGPSRTGPGKETTYESGMMPVGDTRKRFNVRFYLLAMIFLVFDVEIIFFYPWASIFGQYVRSDHVPEGLGMSLGALMLIDMLLFVSILLVAYVYAWGKGVFKFE